MCGIVVRPGLDKIEATRLFFISQMEFAGTYVPVADHLKCVPHFMLEFVEKLVDKASKIK